MRGIMRGKCSRAIFLWFLLLSTIAFGLAGCQFAAAIEAVFRVDAAGGARRGDLPGKVRALPLSHVDASSAWAGVTGADETEGHALRRAAYRRAPDGSDPEWAAEMPATPLTDDQLNDLLAYLHTL